jgi:hypothetical protein
MSLDKLLKQIRSIIREEIEYALDKKLNESKKNDDKKTLQHGMSLMKELSSVKKQPQKQPQKESKQIRNSKSGLNSIQDILNETRMSMEAAMSEDDYPEIRFTTDSIGGGPVRNMVPSGYNEEELTPEVSKALTRDYSALMARLNEKKGA